MVPEGLLYKFQNLFFSLLENEGRVVNSKFIDVSCFVNHEINTQLFCYAGQALSHIYNNPKPDVIITAESSGNSIATAIALNLDYMPNVIVERKKESITWNGKKTIVTGKSVSQTKGSDVCFHAVRDNVNKYGSYLFVDDFLRSGTTFKKIFESLDLEVVGVFNLVAILEGENNVKKITGLSDKVVSGITISDVGKDYLFVDTVLGREVGEKICLEGVNYEN
jgi:adenine/guanine phosphoribosyltransferase-like PRPP-binding protein